jgi:hypothetical protein
MANFKVVSEYQPSGDQPKAIEDIVRNFTEGKKSYQTLKGVTGSGRVDEMVSNPQTAFVRGLMSSGLAKSRWLRDLETGDRIRNPQ